MQGPQQFSPQQQQQWQQQQQQQGRPRDRTILTLDAEMPQPDVFPQLASQLQREPGVKEVALRRDGSRSSHIRVQATEESLPNIYQTFNTLVNAITQQYQQQQGSS